MDVLIVEDEPHIAEILSDYLKQSGYNVRCLDRGETVVASVRASTPDLILLDLMIPGADGLDICRDIRLFSEVPIIIVSARADELDRLLGLETGADDYICKPFSPREVVARVKTVLKRIKQSTTGGNQYKMFYVDDDQNRIAINGTVLDLTPTEFRLLRLLLSRPGKVFSRTQLLESCCHELEAFDRVVDSHIKNLRKKTSKFLNGEELIHAVYGIGYRLEFQEPEKN